MSIFGQSADSVFASDTLDGGAISTAGTPTAGNGSSGGLVDRIFSTGSDYVSQFLDYQAQTRLLQEQTKYRLAEAQQAQMLGLAETTQNTGANPQPLYVPQQQAIGISPNMLMIGGLLLAAIMLTNK